MHDILYIKLNKSRFSGRITIPFQQSYFLCNVQETTIKFCKFNLKVLSPKETNKLVSNMLLVSIVIFLLFLFFKLELQAFKTFHKFENNVSDDGNFFEIEKHKSF